LKTIVKFFEVKKVSPTKLNSWTRSPSWFPFHSTSKIILGFYSKPNRLY